MYYHVGIKQKRPTDWPISVFRSAKPIVKMTTENVEALDMYLELWRDAHQEEIDQMELHSVNMNAKEWAEWNETWLITLLSPRTMDPQKSSTPDRETGQAGHGPVVDVPSVYVREPPVF